MNQLAIAALLSLTISVSCFSQESQDSEFAQNALQSENHSILMEAVEASQINHILKHSGPFTVFAPSNDAFERYSDGKIEELLHMEDKTKLKRLIGYHIVSGNLTASRILRALSRGKGKTSFTTIQGSKIDAYMEGADIILVDNMGNKAKITVADTYEGTSVVHQIDSVISPTRI